MLELVNLSNDITDTEGLLGGNSAQLASFLQRHHLDGIEFMCCAPWDKSFHQPDIIKGFHLWFWPSWLDFGLGNEAALLREFGSLGNIESCFGAS
ncbi:MAG: xylose isomerase, partial [Anaerovibrio sp.]|nr:xylose isomerase [Anaerovibrio sp.]MDY2602748.1 xylose isomerase [Anaerovibrio sp.]